MSHTKIDVGDDVNLQIVPPPVITSGNTAIYAFHDGLLRTSVDVAVGLETAECERLTGISRDETLHLSVNEYLFEAGGRLCLIDPGAGVHSYRRSAG